MTPDAGRRLLEEAQTINQVTKVVFAAVKMAYAARRAKDIPALEQVIELKEMALRAGGTMLRSGLTEASELGLSEKLASRMLRVADLTPDEFEQRLRRTRQKGLSVVTAEARLRMVASPWIIDGDGALARTIMAVEVDAP
jgi:hypothetical protein